MFAVFEVVVDQNVASGAGMGGEEVDGRVGCVVFSHF